MLFRSNVALNIPAYTTTVFWITEYNAKDAPDAPVWETTEPLALDTTPYGTNVVLNWRPSTEPQFYSYEVYRDEQTNRISPDPLATPPDDAPRRLLGRHGPGCGESYILDSGRQRVGQF